MNKNNLKGSVIEQNILQKIHDNNKALEYLKFLYNAPKSILWRGYSSVPPNSFIDIVSKVFFDNTNISLEIPKYISLALISASLLKRKVRIKFTNGEIIKPDLWIIILSDSGTGKTYSLKHLSSISQVEEFPEFSSAARFITELAKNNNSIWLRDEFGQFLKSIEEQGYLRELKDYLLQLFDGKKITRATKQDNIQILDPALSLIGMSVKSTFLKNITLESMLDGFAQRFQYVVANSDPQRHFSDFPVWTVGEHINLLKDYWDKLWQNKIFEEYIFLPEAINEFKVMFKKCIDDSIPESFYRRILFRIAKYGLIYHILLNKSDQYIDAEDIHWSSRLITTQLEDAKNLIEDYSITSIEKNVRAVEALALRFGRNPTPREVIRHVNAIKTSHEAYALLKINNMI